MKKRVVAWLLSVTLTVAMMPITVSFALSYSDYSTVPIGSYQSFRDTVIGKAYNVDGNHGAQCWDGACILWKRLGSNLQTGNGYAKGCWDLKKSENAGSNFDLIYNISDVKRGDVVVFSTGTTGHIGFADEDYSGSGNIAVLAQNQGSSRTKVTSYDSDGGCYESAFNVTSLSVSTFLGAFRYKGWYSHTHSFSSAWTYDSTNHWHNCTGCTEISGKAAHSFNSGIVTAEPTYYDVGIKTYTCTVCGYFYTEEIPTLIPSGYCGGDTTAARDSESGYYKNLEWVLEKDGTLTISGKGEIYSYSTPWSAWNDKITNATIEKGVTNIPQCAFRDCQNLTSVTIPDTVTRIDSSAFHSCSKLDNVIIPSSVTHMDGWTFYGCSSLKSIVIPASVSTLGPNGTNAMFENCSSLTDVKILGNIASIGWDAFYGCSSLISVTLPTELQSIDHLAFMGCSSLTDITIPKSVTSIAHDAFSECSSLKKIIIPNNVTNIESGTFASCSSLKDVTIGNGVISIGEYAFAECNQLTSLSIPDSVTDIGRAAFLNCSKLSCITFSGDAPTAIDPFAFYGCASDFTIHAPKNNATWTSGTAYNAAAQTWNGYPIVFDGTDMPDLQLCDLNGDNITDAADLAILARHVAKIELITDIDKENLADVNGDTFVTAADLTAFVRLIKVQQPA